jgi:hypothetical protein
VPTGAVVNGDRLDRSGLWPLLLDEREDVMEYVSAEWWISAGGDRLIKAYDAEGNEYLIPNADTDVPPWPDFLKKHGLKAIRAPQVDPADE